MTKAKAKKAARGEPLKLALVRQEMTLDTGEALEFMDGMVEVHLVGAKGGKATVMVIVKTLAEMADEQEAAMIAAAGMLF